MADIDRQKEIVTFLRNTFFFLMTTLFGLVGYEFLHFEKLSNIYLIILNIVIVVLGILELIVAINLKKAIDRLKDL